MTELRIAPNHETIVDVSNVCRDRDLAPRSATAAWSRFTRLTAALRDAGAQRIAGVADANLRHLLSAADRRQLRTAEADGLVVTVPGSADDEILRRAERTGAMIVSHDRFAGHRRKRPWLQGCTDRVLGWTEIDGDLRITPVDLGFATAQSMSRGEEADLLRERHLDPFRRPSDLEVLQHAYRCPNPTCLRSRLSPERLDTLPERSDGHAICPWCQTELEDLGARLRGVEVVIERDGRELGRKAIARDAEIVLGRDDLGDDAGDAAKHVSREHLRLRCRDGKLWVADAKSLNGTSIARWNSCTRELDTVQRLARGEAVELGQRDVVLIGAYRLRRSGQRFALASTSPDAQAPIVVPPTDEAASR